jgi:hypothetical protein
MVCTANFKNRNLFLYIHPLIFYNSSKLLHLFCRTPGPCTVTFNICCASLRAAGSIYSSKTIESQEMHLWNFAVRLALFAAW